MEDTLVHEMVHMYDHAKFKVDWDNIRHHACTEVRQIDMKLVIIFNRALSQIRAANLSGDCRFGREVKRGFFAFSKQHQVRQFGDIPHPCLFVSVIRIVFEGGLFSPFSRIRAVKMRLKQ